MGIPKKVRTRPRSWEEDDIHVHPEQRISIVREYFAEKVRLAEERRELLREQRRSKDS